MKKVFEVEVTKDVTADDCATWLEAHHSWQVKAGRRLCATKRSDAYTTVHYVSGKGRNMQINELGYPVDFARENLNILGEAKGPVAERIFKCVNQPPDYN